MINLYQIYVFINVTLLQVTGKCTWSGIIADCAASAVACVYDGSGGNWFFLLNN